MCVLIDRPNESNDYYYRFLKDRILIHWLDKRLIFWKLLLICVYNSTEHIYMISNSIIRSLGGIIL